MWIYYKMSFISVMRSCIFSIITPVFSVTWSSEIILIYWFAQEAFMIIVNVENFFFFLLNIFCENSATPPFKSLG